MSYFDDHMRRMGFGYLPPAMSHGYTQLAGDVVPFTGNAGAGQVPGAFGNMVRTLQPFANAEQLPQIMGGPTGFEVPQMYRGIYGYGGNPANQP